jgi:hypothetical protein
VNGDFELFDDAGHALPIQCADRVNTVLARHLAAAAAPG